MTLRMIPASGQTYTQILKSTMLMGGSSPVNVALSVRGGGHARAGRAGMALRIEVRHARSRHGIFRPLRLA